MFPNRNRPGELLLSAGRAFRQSQWQPLVDAYRTPTGWLLKYELAGVGPDEVEVTVSERTITVRGTRRDIRVDECQQSHVMEISYNQFERVVELPSDLSGLRPAVEFRNGMLIVRLAP
jgi:HSP20 family protein